MKGFLNLIPLLILLGSWNYVLSQDIKVTDISIENNIAFGKVAWIKNGKFCVVTDKDFNGAGFPHLIHVYNEKGKPVYDPIKVRSPFSCQSDFCFALGTTLFFLNGGMNDMNAHEMSIVNVVKEDGSVDDLIREIFYVRHTPESKKIIDPAYSFKIYPGVKKNKALITYNNNYKDPYKEGFIFRVLDKDNKLSETDSLSLPYLDRQCNINDVVYDDENSKVFILGDLFETSSADKREFKNSFVAKYDLLTKKYVELVLPEISFNRNKVQHAIIDNQIIFSGIYLDKYLSSKGSASFVIVNTEELNLISGRKFSLDSNLIDKIYIANQELDRDFILPMNLSVNKDGSIQTGWTKFFTISQMLDKNQDKNGAIGAAWFMFGIVGGLAAAAMTSGSAFKNVSFGYSLKYSPQSSKLEEKLYSSELQMKKYAAHSFSLISSNSETMWVMNSPTRANAKQSDIDFFDASINCSQCDSVERVLNTNGLNLIYPLSLLVEGDKNYFIGEYNTSNDPAYKTGKEDKYFLVEID